MEGSGRGKKKAALAGEEAVLAELSLEQALEQLEQIAKELESGALDLEHSLKRYREARELYNRCVARLGEAEREVRLLMADGSTEAADLRGGEA